MRKLLEVEEAKALMTEAADWSVMKWLREKKRVRKTADKANDALDALNEEVKAGWKEELKAAYKKQDSSGGDPQIASFVKSVRHADEEAYRARMEAEETFDEAERQLSAAMAREGCRKAIHSWELHEKAIRKAEAAAGLK
jgi:hypothetical protein